MIKNILIKIEATFVVFRFCLAYLVLPKPYDKYGYKLIKKIMDEECKLLKELNEDQE